MSRTSTFPIWVLSGLLVTVSITSAKAQTQSVGKAERAMQLAGKQGKYTFLLFYKSGDTATRQMASVLKESLADKADRATVVYVQKDETAERAIVAKYGVSRAPMPFTMAIAPNGAITGVFPQRVTADQVADSFVTPTMLVTMKSLQSGKIVLVDARGSEKAARPAALKAFESDPHFKDRVATVSMRVGDSREAKFVKQMQLDPSSRAGQIVLIAPPGVLVGKFQAGATKEQIAAALAKAGKCCNDPKCKHIK